MFSNYKPSPKLSGDMGRLSYCIFCFKPATATPEPEQGNITRFRIQLLERYLKMESTSKFEFQLCQPCTSVLASFSTLYDQFKRLELKLEEKIGNVRKIINYSSRITDRIKLVLEFYERRGDLDRLGQIDQWRRSVSTKCSHTLATSLPRVVLSRLSEADAASTTNKMLDSPASTSRYTGGEIDGEGDDDEEGHDELDLDPDIIKSEVENFSETDTAECAIHNIEDDDCVQSQDKYHPVDAEHGRYKQNDVGVIPPASSDYLSDYKYSCGESLHENVPVVQQTVLRGATSLNTPTKENLYEKFHDIGIIDSPTEYNHHHQETNDNDSLLTSFSNGVSLWNSFMSDHPGITASDRNVSSRNISSRPEISVNSWNDISLRSSSIANDMVSSTECPVERQHAINYPETDEFQLIITDFRGSLHSSASSVKPHNDNSQTSSGSSGCTDLTNSKVATISYSIKRSSNDETLGEPSPTQVVHAKTWHPPPPGSHRFPNKKSKKGCPPVTSSQTRHYLNQVKHWKYQCSLCGSKYRCKSKFKLHLSTHKTTNCICQYCGAHFPSGNLLMDHLTLTHAEFLRSHKSKSVVVPIPNSSKNSEYPRCAKCGKLFASNMHLTEHYMLNPWHKYKYKYSNYGKYKCSICGKACLDNWKLARHMRAHERQMQHACRQYSSFSD